MPVGLPAGLNVPEDYRPIARLDDNGSYLLAYGNTIEVMEPSGECRFSRTLDSEPLCVVPGSSSGSIIVMTHKRAYGFTRMTLVPLGSSPLALPTLSVAAETPVSATMPSVRLSAAYGHGDSISVADTARLVAASRQLYEDLESNVRETGRFWQPVVVRIRALSSSGRVLFESEPRLITHPVEAEWQGRLSLTAASDGLSTNELDVQVPTYSVHLHTSELGVLSNDKPVASYEVLATPCLHHSDISLQPEVATPRRAGTQTLCTVTFRPGVLDSPAPSARPSRLREIIGHLSELESSLAEYPCERLAASQSEQLPPPAAVTAESAVKMLKKVLAKPVVPDSGFDALLQPPHSFTAAVVAGGADTLLWGGVEVYRFDGWGVEAFADTVTDAAWQAAVEVTFADGSSVVRGSSGSSNAPATLGPLLSYPSADAVSITISLSVSGQTLRKATFPLIRDPSARHSVHVNPTMRAFELPAAGGNFEIPAADSRVLDYHDHLVLCSADAPLLPVASAKVASGSVNALAEAAFGQSSWDFGRVRYYVFTSRGIYLLSASSSRRAMSMSLIDSRIVRSRYTLAPTEQGLAAVASGDIVLLSGSKARRIDKGDLGTVTALEWVHDRHELWCICPDTTEVLCFDSDMSRYTIPLAFEEAHDAGVLTGRDTGRCYLAGHDAGATEVSIRWTGYLEPYGRHCFGLKTLALYMAGKFEGLRISLSRCSLLAEAPMPELDLTLSGTVRFPLCRRVFIHPRLRLKLTVEGKVSTDSRFYKIVLYDN